MNPGSDFDCEIFQRVLANAFAVQERRNFVAAHTAPLEAKDHLAPAAPLPEVFGEITDPEETFVPEFMMFPQNRHSLCARWGAVIVGVKDLPGFRHLALLATILARRGRTVTPNDQEHDFVSAPVAPAVSQKAKILNPRSRWRNFAPPAIAPGLARRAKSFDWPSLRGNLALTEVASGLKRRAKNLDWSSPWRNWRSSNTTTFVSGLANRARNLRKLGRWRTFGLSSSAPGFAQQANSFGWSNRPRNFTLPVVAPSFLQRTKSLGMANWRLSITPATGVSAFSRRTQSLNWSNLRRCSAPVAVIAVVLNFTFLMAYKPSHPATMLGPSALPGANANAETANAMEQRSSTSIPKPLPGKPATAETASAPPKPIRSPAKTERRKRVGPNEVEYIGDDVTVRTFTRRSTKPSREANSRTAHIGDDVTVRYFASSPPARSATR